MKGWVALGLGAFLFSLSEDEEKTESEWEWPLGKGCISLSSPYGRRPNPFANEATPSECHKGLDIPCAMGSPVRAAKGGTVERADFLSESAGGYIRIRHKNRWATKYMHLSAIFVRPGDVVAQGQHIGNIGSTGRSTGPHLHFEVRNAQDVAQDPGPLMGLPAGTPC